MSFLEALRPHRDEMPFEPTDEELRIVGEHYDDVVSLRDQGELVVAGPSVVRGDTIGIGVLDVDDEREVRAIVPRIRQS